MSNRFREKFDNKATVFAVVHSDSIEQTIRNVSIAVDSWLDWVFLINHEITWDRLLRIFRITRQRFENIWMWINLLEYNIDSTFNKVWLMEAAWYRVDWIWTDNPEINWINPWYDNQDKLKEKRNILWWNGLYFWWVAFKYQKQPEDISVACQKWQEYLDVITTSWSWTWKAADMEKIKKMRELSSDFPMALASWVDESNIWPFSEYTQAFLVASSICKKWDFLNFDPEKVKNLARAKEKINS